jgi:hypothetical protein
VLYRRFVIAFVLLGVVLVSLSVFRDHLTQQRYIAQESGEVVGRAQQRLNMLLTSWQHHAQQNIRTIAFMQLAAKSPQQQSNLLERFYAQIDRCLTYRLRYTLTQAAIFGFR